MTRMLLAFAVLLLAILLGVTLQHDPGYVLIQLKHWSIETTLWIMLPSLLFAFLLFHALLLMLHAILRWPHAWRQWRQDQKLNKTHAQTEHELNKLNMLRLIDVYINLNEWQQLIALLPKIKKHHIITESAYITLEEQAYTRRFEQLLRETTQPKIITEFLRTAPKSVMSQPPCNALYADFLLKHQAPAEAERLLRRALHKTLHPNLLNSYGQLPISSAKLAFIEGLYKKHPTNPALLVCLARLSMNAQLWGKAKDYFEAALDTQPAPHIYLEYGQLLEKINDREGACKAYYCGLSCQVSQRNTVNTM